LVLRRSTWVRFAKTQTPARAPTGEFGQHLPESIDLSQSQQIVAAWVADYNTARPHGVMDMRHAAAALLASEPCPPIDGSGS